MAKFVFNLNGLLNIKEKFEDQKKMEYGKAVSNLEYKKQLKEELVEMRNHYINLFRESLQAKIEPDEIVSFNDYIELIKRQIKNQQLVIDDAARNVRRTQAELAEAMKDRKIYETLKENKYAAYLKSEQLAEQKFIDQIVSYKHKKVK